jgi:6-phosphofructokinase 1
LTRSLTVDDVEYVLDQGGTILGSSRTNPYKLDRAVDRIRANLSAAGVDALIAIGGEDTLGVAQRLNDDGVPAVGVPKTIDNDLSATDYTFGFDTAVAIATEAIDRLRTTAESHHRAVVVEVMGRHAGWIALHSGLAGGAHGICIPEVEFDPATVCGWVQSRFARDRSAVIVVAEGAMPKGGAEVLSTGEVDAFGHVRLGGVGTWLAAEIERVTERETRAVVLGHVQRGGTPTAYDRVLSTRFGLAAIEAVHDKAFGSMVALRGTDIVRVPLSEATAELKTVPPARYAEAEVFFG